MADDIELVGCVNKTTGEVEYTFEHLCFGPQESCEDNSACSLLVCFEQSGLNEGQVSLTVLNSLCDDTFYGCLEDTEAPNIGKFIITIPKECSYLCCGCVDQTFEQDCFANDEVPESMYIKVTGVEQCEGVGAGPVSDFNDQWICLPLITDPDFDCPGNNFFANQCDLLYQCSEFVGKSGTTYIISYCMDWPFGEGGNTVFAIHDFLLPLVVSDNTYFWWNDSGTANPIAADICVTTGTNLHVSCQLTYFGKNGTFIAVPCAICEDSPAWDKDTTYVVPDLVFHTEDEEDICYVCIQGHGPDPDDHEPGVAVDWEEYWERFQV